MKPEDLQEALGLIGEDLYDNERLKPKERSCKRIKWTAVIAAILAASILVTFMLLPADEATVIPDKETTDTHSPIEPEDSNIFLYNGTLAEAIYPDSPLYPTEYSDSADEWYNFYQEMDAEFEELDIDLDKFYIETCKVFFSDEYETNTLYSPVNLYMALAMLAEISEGESRQQLLELADCESIEQMRKNAKAIWRASYKNDGVSSLILANSLWLDEDFDYKQATLDTLAEYYYASSFSGECGSEEFNEALRGWMNYQTKGVLEDSVNDIEIPAESLLCLASTIYFYAKWTDEFDPELTKSDIFHSPTGDTECDFMHSSSVDNYYWGETFSSVKKHLGENGTMYFILPDEGFSPNDLLCGDEIYRFIHEGDLWQNRESLIVNLSLPKFDVSSKEDLKDPLRELGVTDIFEISSANLGNLTDTVGCVTQIEHSVRVNIDEEGCEAAAYTIIMEAGATRPPEEEIDFILDRPFIFVITSDAGIPLYTGIVNQP